MNTAENGIWSGLLATGPMTLAMFALHNKLPNVEKSPLPPATLTSQFTSLFGLDQKLSQNPRENLTMLSHFGYGAACGLLYAFGFKKLHPHSALLKGTLFGLGVWASSYMGWIPAFGLRANAYQMPAKRNGLMILAHIIWGASIGLAEFEMRRFGNQMLDGHRKASQAE